MSSPELSPYRNTGPRATIADGMWWQAEVVAGDESHRALFALWSTRTPADAGLAVADYLHQTIFLPGQEEGLRIQGDFLGLTIEDIPVIVGLEPLDARRAQSRETTGNRGEVELLTIRPIIPSDAASS